MRLDDVFARAHEAEVRLTGQLVRHEHEEESALQQRDAEEPRHEAQVRVVLEDIADGIGGRHRVHDGAREGLGGDPQVLVVQKVDGVPFAGDENVEDVHDMRSVRDDDFGLN